MPWLCGEGGSMSHKLKVLYIMGTARSGSTILEILLSHGEHCVGAGELTSIVQDGFIENKPCSCGWAFNECGFWSQVVAKMALTRKEVTEWARLQHKIEWHTGFLRQLLGLISGRDWKRYKDYNLRLLKVLHDISGAAVIVDSSKYAGRALALSRMPEIDLSVICLTRSPEGLMTSFQKPNKEEQRPKKPWAVFRYYAFVMFSLRIATWRLKDRVLAMKYEDILVDPRARLTAIAKLSNDVKLDSVIERIEQGEAFEVGHLVTGNRLRNNRQMRLNRDMKPINLFPLNARTPIVLMNFFEQLLRRTISG